MSDQEKLIILKRELASARRKIVFSIILLWVIIFVSEFYLDLGVMDGYLSFIVAVLLTTPIWYYYKKREKKILTKIAQLNT